MFVIITNLDDVGVTLNELMCPRINITQWGVDIIIVYFKLFEQSSW